MYEVNRSVLVIKPKQPFVDWLLSLPFRFDPEEVNLRNLREDCNALLVPPVEDFSEVRDFIKANWSSLFEAELADWCEDDSLWPTPRTQNLFSQWFEVETHSVVTDLAEAPLEREAFDALDLPDAE